jgi:uncharacterized membrane protein
MELLAELFVELVLALGFVLFGWCLRHKNITLAIAAIALVAADIFVLFRLGVFH